MAGSCEHGNEPPGSDASELVSYLLSNEACLELNISYNY
jgi:hypothetical protein